MKGIASILALAAIIGAVLVMSRTETTSTTTMERIVTGPVDAVISAVESALAETDFHAVESKTSRDAGVEGRFAAANPSGSVMSLVFDALPQDRFRVQITISGDARDEAATSLLAHRVDNALRQFQEQRASR